MTQANPIKLNNDSDAVGRISITLVYPDRSEVFYEEDNLIVLNGRIRLLQPLYIASITDPIVTLRVGNGGTIDPLGKFPKPVSKELTSLWSEVQQVPVAHALDLGYPSVTFIADIDPSQCNNFLVSEAGLFTTSGMMFNIKTFPGIPKTQDFSIHFEWTIRIN